MTAISRHSTSRHPTTWLFVAWLGVRLLLVLWPGGPQELDEMGYLGNARFLASGEGNLAPEGRAPYKLGYSLLLVPGFWGAEVGDPEHLERALLVTRLVGALLMASMLPLAAALAGRLDPDLEPLDRAWIGAAIAVQPSAVLYGTTAMSENVLFPGYLLFLYLAHRSLVAGPETGRRSWLFWPAWGAVAVYLYSVHERALGWMLVAVAASLGAAVLRRRPEPLALAAVVAAGVPATGWAAASAQVPGTLYPTGSSAGAYLAGLASYPLTLVATLLGQLWYLHLATLGLLFAGLWLAARHWLPSATRWLMGSSVRTLASTCRGRRAAMVGFYVVWAASAGSMISLSILFMGQRPEARVTHWLYGRYNESVLAGLMVVVWIALRRLCGARRRAVEAAAVTGLAFLAATAVLRHLWQPIHDSPYAFNLPSVPAFSLFHWGWLRSAALALLVSALASVAVCWRWRLGVAAVAAFQLGASVAGALDADWRGKRDWRARERHLAEVVRGLSERTGNAPAVICYDDSPWPNFHFYHYDFHLPRTRLEPARVDAPEACAGQLWISPRLDLDHALPGARLVALETLPPDFPPYLQALWVLPGPYLDSLAEGGRLMPTGFPSALPEGALAGSILGSEVGTLELAMGEGFGVQVKSAGSTPWPHLPGLRRLDHRVVLHVRWWAASAEPVAADAVDLPRMIFPGDTVHLEVPAPHTPGGIDGLGTWAPLGPGEYRVSVEIDQYLEDRWRGHDGAAEQVQVRIR